MKLYLRENVREAHDFLEAQDEPSEVTLMEYLKNICTHAAEDRERLKRLSATRQELIRQSEGTKRTEVIDLANDGNDETDTDYDEGEEDEDNEEDDDRRFEEYVDDTHHKLVSSPPCFRPSY